jgi:phosphopantothenate--cysteine ligase
MKKLNVVITAGGTREYLDDVRVLTNISTGKLGSKIADEFLAHGHEVTYVSPESARMPADANTGHYSYVKVTDVNSVMEAMRILVPKADVVIQSMAVSDFTFNLSEALKVSGESPEAFVEHIRKTITKTPKVIANFRKWNPKAILVGFKFTVGKKKDELTEIATKLMKDNKLDMVFANDKAQMKKAGEHVGILIMKDWSEELHNKDEIAKTIYSNVIRTI